jgi:hypothetical protein
MHPFAERKQRLLWGDGGCGTMFHAHRVSFEQCFGALNRIAPGSRKAPREGLELIEAMRQFASGICLMPAFSRCNLPTEMVEECKNS